MKILIFNWRDIKNPEAGGAEVYLHEIFRRIVKEHKVFLISSKFPGCKEKEYVDGIQIQRIGDKLTFNYSAFWYYLKNLKKLDFDVVIDAISKVPLFTPLYVKKPILAILHHIHGKTLFVELPRSMALYVYFFEKLIPFIYKKIPFVVVSQSTKNELIKIGIPEKNIHIVYNGINIKTTGLKNEIRKPQVIYFGRIKRYKQIDHLIKAFGEVKKCIPYAELVIAGKYVHTEGIIKELKELAKKNKIESSIHFLGEISEEQKVKILQESWVAVTPSMKEGWGITVIEANACGVPVIGYNVEGTRDTIKHGETGLLVKPNDISELSRAIIKVLNDKKLYDKLKEGAIKWASNFSWDKSAQNFMKILEKVHEFRFKQSSEIK